METSYTAWDGEELPWPPPENWYRAEDGRWWHPAHSPEDPPNASDDRAEGGDGEGANDDPDRAPSVVVVGTRTEPGSLPSEQLPYWNVSPQPDRPSNSDDDVRFNRSPPNADIDVPGLSDRADVPNPRRAAVAPADLRSSQRTHGEADQIHHTTVSHVRLGQGDDDRPDDDEPGRFSWRSTGLLLASAATVLVLFLFARAGDDVTQADQPSDENADATTADSTGASEAAGMIMEPSALETGAQSSPGPDLRDGGDGDQGAVGAAAQAGTAAARISDFRVQLESRGLLTGRLTDDQISAFASTYCVYAGGAESSEAFDQLRAESVAGSTSALNEDQLNLTISTAVVVFCPEDADRLGIDLD